MRDITERNNK